MQLIRPSVEFLWMTPEPLKEIERAGRTCYKSEDKITENSAQQFVGMLINRGHEAMLEHASLSYKVICDRGVTHEIVRHRLFSYAQESTRYCNYSGGVRYLIPCWLQDRVLPGNYDGFRDAAPLAGPSMEEDNFSANQWLRSMWEAELSYRYLVDKMKCTPQQARSVLPNSLKTEIVITGNLREWRHFFKLRTDSAAHPDMQVVANMLLTDANERIPTVFSDYLTV